MRFLIGFIFLLCISISLQAQVLVDSTAPKMVVLHIDEPAMFAPKVNSENIEVFCTDEHNLAVADAQIYVKQVNGNIKVDQVMVITDSLGIAEFKVSDLQNGEKYSLLFYTQDNGLFAQPVVYEFKVRSSKWVFNMIIGLLGGLSLFLLGMGMMSKGMQNSAGDQMRNILQKLTNNRFVAVGLGAFITTIIQSSSATNVMLVSFVNSRLMHFRQTIGIILGAAIGTTITAQIIAFKLTDFALVFVSIGLALHLMTKRNGISEICRAILGFGILFYGMHIMSDAMYPLRSYQGFIDLIVQLEKPVIGILVGALFTALIQSSSAFIGILIILSMQGMLSLEAAISLVIGANIGTAITAILASLNTSREAKQVALAHTLIKIFGAALFIFVIPFFTQIVNAISNVGTEGIATPREIANAHTVYNVVLCALILPFTNSVAWVVNKIFPVKEEIQTELSVSYIDDSLLDVPSLALKAAHDELLIMIDEVQEMVRLIIQPFFDKSMVFAAQVDAAEERVDYLRDSISDFLIKLTKGNVADGDVNEAFILLNAVREYEEMADVVAVQMKKKAIEWQSSKHEFSAQGKNELQHYHELTLKLLRKSAEVYETLDLKQAKKLKSRYYDFRDEYFDMERSHYQRLQYGVTETEQSSQTHLEIITLLKVISSHATNTARIIISEKPQKKKGKK